MRRWMATLIAVALVIVGLWGPDSLVTAQSDCVSRGAVGSGETTLAADCEVLLDVRDTLAGTATLNWAADVPIEYWEGITVGGTPLRVTGIRLVHAGLTGTIPPQLGRLSSLTELWLRGNRLTGAIPSELGNLTKLTELGLWENQLTGAIPSELGNLTKLTELGLWENQLTGTIPGELDNLSNLTYLSLGYNHLTGPIPSELGGLSNLKRLDLSGNQLTGTIPEELGDLSSLRSLQLNKNQLSGSIPRELGNLTNLAGLHLSRNQLSGEIPAELGNLSDLWWLSLRGNQLSGSIPRSFTNLASLFRFDFSDNAGLCAPIDDEFRAWLQSILDLEGPLCDSPADLAVLVKLYEATDGANWEDNSNWLNDRPMGTWYGVTTDDEGRVTELHLAENQLNGQIPAELGKLANLRTLNLAVNQLNGSIPSELGDLSNLWWLYLSGNQLHGQIPSELGNLSDLWWLTLSHNQLTGEIPDSLTGLTRLFSLAFYSNAGLCAPINDTFQAWLQGIDIVHGSSCAPHDSQDDEAVLVQFYNSTNGVNWDDNSNWLSNQPIRAWYGVTNDMNGRVTGLYLWENQLSGPILSGLGDLSSLKRLYLNDNQLSGAIPPELGNLSDLRWLRLGGNPLTGCIPAELRDVEFNDFDDVGLPFCGIPAVTVSVGSESYRVRINSPIPVTATFSEPVNGFTASDITVANGSVGNFAGSDGDSVFTFDVTPNAVGVVTVDIPADVAQDSDGNGNTAAEQLTLGLPYDDDHDGVISRDEVATAIGDYLFGGGLTRDQAIRVINLYLFG